MQIPNCPLLHNGGYTNFECLKLVETAGELRLGPAFPARQLGITCSLIILMTVGGAAVEWQIIKRNPPTMLVVGFLTAFLVFCFVWIKFQWESKKGAVFIVDKNNGRYFFPRKAMDGDHSDLVAVILVGGKLSIPDDQAVELQILLERNGEPPAAMLLVSRLGVGNLVKMQNQLAAALHLPAFKCESPG